MGTESFIQLPLDGTGKKTRMRNVNVSGNLVHQQVVLIADSNDNIINPATAENQTNGSQKVAIVQDPDISKVILYGDAMIAPTASAVLATYTVPAGKRFYFKGGLVGGDEYGEFSFEISAGRIGLWRNSGSARSALINFPELPEASASAVIEIVATNNGNKTKQFEATLYGHTKTV